MFSSANTLVQPCLILILIPQVRDWAKDSIPVHLFQELTTSESWLLTLEIPDNPYLTIHKQTLASLLEMPQAEKTEI